jgi:hypothetical protein
MAAATGTLAKCASKCTPIGQVQFKSTQILNPATENMESNQRVALQLQAESINHETTCVVIRMSTLPYAVSYTNLTSLTVKCSKEVNLYSNFL